MEADCTAHPFRETNRRAHRASHERVVAKKQTVTETRENKSRRPQSPPGFVLLKRPIRDRSEKEMAQQQRKDRSTCRAEQKTARTGSCVPIHNKTCRHPYDAP